MTVSNEANIHRPPINCIAIFRRDLDEEIYYKTSDDKIHKVDQEDGIYKIQKVSGFLGFTRWQDYTGQDLQCKRITSQEFFFTLSDPPKVIIQKVGGRRQNDNPSGTPNLQQVLAVGNDGGGQSIINTVWNGSAIGTPYGGTGINSSASTGVAQVLAGVWSISTALANGTTAATQFAGTNNTTVATTAFVQAAIAGIGTPTLSQVLASGNNAGGQAAFNFVYLGDALGVRAVAVNSRELYDSTDTIALGWNTRTLFGAWALGTPASVTLTNATGLPIVGGTTGTLSVARGGTGITTIGAGEILYATAANTIGSAADFVRLSTGEVGIGMTPVNALDITYNTTGGARIKILNSNAATGATAVLQASNGTTTGSLVVRGTGYTTSGMLIANGTELVGDGVAGVSIIASNASGTIKFGTGGFASSNERARFLSTGEFIIGATSLVATELVSIQKNANSITQLIIRNTTSGTGARATLSALTNGNLGISIQAISPAYTTSGMLVASTSVINSSSLAGFNIGTTSATQFSSWTNNIKRLEIDSNGKVNVISGILPDGGGFKHSRVTTGAVGAGSTALVTVTWGTAFADANYTAQASVVDSTTSSLSLSVVHIESVAAGSVTVRVLNNAVVPLTGTLHVTAIHD